MVDVEVGGTIGQYRVTEMIGRGGMGAVYAAEHVLLGRPAAIKVLLPELSQNQGMVMRFFNEARAATAIRHPGIVEIYDFGWSAGGAAFIVMEHLEGETLSRRASRARIGWRAALVIVRQIAGALGAAHVKGIVHRDLKPDNIFLVRDPEVPGGERIKLLDFGIAKLAAESSPGLAMTRTGAVMGTPTYMSPEQCRGVVADHRSDLYALGCIAFELCGGRPPFVGEATGDVLAAHIHVPAPSLATLTGEVPPEVERLVQRLLAKSPAERVQSANDVIGEIDAVSGNGVHGKPLASSERLPVMVPRPITTLSSATTGGLHATHPTRRRTGARVLAATTLATAVLVAVVMWRDAMGRDEDDGSRTSAPNVSAPARATGPVAAVPPASTPAPAPSASAPSSANGSAATARAALTPAAAPVEPAGGPPQPTAPDPVEVAVDSVPAGAQITIGGAPLGKTPFHGALPRHSGEVTLVIRLPGHAEKSVVVRSDRAISEHIKLVPLPAARAPKVDRDGSVNPFGE